MDAAARKAKMEEPGTLAAHWRLSVGGLESHMGHVDAAFVPSVDLLGI
jgi:hypothetical protein